MNEKLTHDASWVTAMSIMECVESQWGEAEDPELFAAIFARVKAGILVHHFLASRPEKPSRN